MILYPHCKVNLGLAITGKREDGFHNIESILYPIYGLTDMLEIVHSDSLELSSSGLVVDSPTEDNLCLRAYMAVKKRYDITPVKIHLHKVIPMGAGLGGGSSDATFVLKGLNKLFNLGISHSELQEISLELGSDTPFFLYDGAMAVSGRGDILTPCPLELGGTYITIVKPNIHISTKEAFANIKPMALAKPLEEIVAKDISQWQGELNNDFEQSIFPGHPTLKGIKETLLGCGGDYVAMSGSGSSIFALSKREITVKGIDNCFIYSTKL